VEQNLAYHSMGNYLTGDYVVDGRRVATITWSATGQIEWERRFDAEGRPHGTECYRYPDGQPAHIARWVHGLQHGWQEHRGEDGGLLARTRFVRGTGLDLWWDDGVLTESRSYRDGRLHGVERWWHSRTLVWCELYWFAGLQHGIERHWNLHHRLARGYPKFFVRGEQVSRRAYLRASAVDPTLSPYRNADDRPRRRPPV
jgi:hypothetical protein